MKADRLNYIPVQQIMNAKSRVHSEYRQYRNLVAALNGTDYANVIIYRCRYESHGITACRRCPGANAIVGINDPGCRCPVCGAVATRIAGYDAAACPVAIVELFCYECLTTIYSCGFGDIMAYKPGQISLEVEDII